MTRLLIVPAVLLAVSPAHAVPPPVSGGGCGYSVPTQDQQPYDDGRHWAVLYSHPIVVGSGLATLTCTVQSGADWSHTGTDVVARTSPATRGAVALPPVSVTFELDSYFSYCSQVDYADGRTFYYDDLTGRWSTDPSVPCYAISWGPPPFVVPVRPYEGSAACPALASAPVLRDDDDPVWVTPEGDVWVGGLRVVDC